MAKQLTLFKSADILPDNLRKIVTKIRADIKKVKIYKEWSLPELKASHHNHLMSNNNVIHLPYKPKKLLFSSSNVRKTNGKYKHS
tara:strand:+ start:489 stop:743 length:255 start_codon:yes stop_codon:yes gene_type:complete